MSQPVFEYTGSIPDGSTLEVDMESQTVTLDGVQVFDFDGDFWALLPGAGGVEYADGEASRSLSLTVTHKDRWA